MTQARSKHKSLRIPPDVDRLIRQAHRSHHITTTHLILQCIRYVLSDSYKTRNAIGAPQKEMDK